MKKIIVGLILAIFLITTYSMTFVLANDEITLSNEGSGNETVVGNEFIEENSGYTNNTTENTTEGGKLPSTGDDFEDYYTSSNPDDRKNNNIKRTLEGKEVSKEDYQNPKYELEYETTSDGKKIWVGTLRNFSIKDLDNVNNANSTILPYSGEPGIVGYDVQADLDYINKYFYLESYQYVGETFEITGLGTFSCQGIKPKDELNNHPLYYMYTCKITSNNFKKEKGKTSYFELIETDVNSGKKYVNFLNLYFTDEKGSQSFSLYDEKTKISISANYSVIPEDAKLVVETITEGEKLNSIKSILGNTSSKIYAYNLTLMQNEAEIQPKDELNIFFPIPKDIDTSKLCVYNITENKKEYDFELSGMADTVLDVLVRTSTMGTYVLTEKNINEKDFDIVDDKSGIKVSADTGVIPDNASLVVNTITSGEDYTKVETALKDIVSKMYVYDISLESDGVEIEPNGKVKINIPIPDDIDISKIAIYRITEKGEKIEYNVGIKIIDNVKYAAFETDHFSTYVLGQKNVDEKTKENEVDDDTKNPNGLPFTGALTGIIVCSIIIGISILFTCVKYNSFKDIK